MTEAYAGPATVEAVALTEPHTAYLVAAAITPEVAEAAGVFSLLRPNPGIVFPFRSRDGRTVMQLRPDQPVGDRKYVWQQGTPLVLNRIRDAEDGGPVVFVEGTKQSLAVASWLPEDYAVYGMVGCRGWAGSDLSWTAGRLAYVLFDADVDSNRDVHDAAEKLGEVLRAEQVEPKFVRAPGTKKEGIDDLLGRRPPDTRTAYLERLLAKADESPGLGKKPGKASGSAWFGENGGLLAQKLALDILDEQPAALTGENTIALYENGVYRVDGGALIEAVARRLGDSHRISHRRTVEEVALAQLYAAGRRLPEHTDYAMVNVRNGMLDLETGVLKPHDPAYLSSTQLPVEWDPDARCPTYEAWLDAMAPGQGDDLEEVVSTMLDPSRTPHKAGFLFGPSRSGKSTFLRLAQAMVGRENCSAVTLRQLSENRFAAANVYGKILNAAADLDADHVEDLSTFKMLTGEDAILADRKFGAQFNYTNRALFLFSANNPPTVGETSRAYFERIKPFEFPRSFAGAEDPRIEEGMLDELPGILVRWVRAWQRMRERGRYAPTLPAVEAKFERASDRVHQWVADECRVTRDASGEALTPGAYVPRDSASTKRHLHRAFNGWAEGNKYALLGERKFLSRLTSINGVVEVRFDDGPSRGGRGLNVVLAPGEADEADSDDSGATTPRAREADVSLLPLVGRSDCEIVNRPTRGSSAESASNDLTASAPDFAPSDAAVPLPVLVTREGEIQPASTALAGALLEATIGTGAALTVDVETTGYPYGHRDYALRTVQLGTAEYALDFDPTDPEQAAAIRTALEAAPKLHAHSATADLVPLAAAGLIDPERGWDRMYDTALPALLADPSAVEADAAGLKQLAVGVLGDDACSAGADKARAALFKARKWKTNVKVSDPPEKSGWAQVDPTDPVMARYAASDVLDTAALADRLPWPGQRLLDRERGVQRVTARVSHRGLRIDLDHTKALRTEHAEVRDDAAERVRSLGVDNPGSGRQIADRLIALEAPLPYTKPTPKFPIGQPSVAGDVLEGLQHAPGEAGELAGAVLTYRHHETLLGTFLEPYTLLCERGDGRARPTILTLGADTGRMSCRRPNLQNVPREGGIRACLTADPGQLLISADFSSVEIKVAAALSQDASLIRMLETGWDVHGEIAKQVFGPDATKANRYTVKRGVFAYLYGGGLETIAKNLGITVAQAQAVVDTLFDLAPALSAWSMAMREEVRAGRLRMFPSYAGRSIHLPPAYPHKVANYLIQGTARELLVDALLRWSGTRWGNATVLPVHDEIVAAVPEAEAAEATAALVAAMETTLHGVPIVAEAAEPSPYWQDAA